MQKRKKLIMLAFATLFITAAIMVPNSWLGAAVSEKLWIKFASKNIHNNNIGEFFDSKLSELFDKFPPVPESKSLTLEDFIDQNPESLDKLRKFYNETSLPLIPDGMENIKTYMDYAERGYVELAPLIAFNTLGLHRESADADDISRTINLLEISARGGILESRAFLAHYYFEKSDEEFSRCGADESTFRTQTLRECLSKSFYYLRAKSYYWGMAPVSPKSEYHKDENGSVNSTNLKKFEETIKYFYAIVTSGYIHLPEKTRNLQ